MLKKAILCFLGQVDGSVRKIFREKDRYIFRIYTGMNNILETNYIIYNIYYIFF